MQYLFLLSLLIGFVSILLVVPLPIFKAGKKFISIILIFAIVTGLGVFGFYYVTNLDQNLSSLWIYGIVVAVLSVVFAKGKERKAKLIICAALLISGVYFSTAGIFSAKQKFQSVHVTEKVEIETFDESETPASVPPRFARNKMKKAFGQVPNTSFYELGKLQIQKVDGEYVYVAPVEFSSFFKWVQGDSTPGYFMMSATDSTDNPKFKREHPMVYTPSAFFNKNIDRHIRLTYPQLIFKGSAQLEVDDNGKPYYVKTYGDFISARNGFDPVGVIVVDPANGSTKKYALTDAPAFIDGAVSPEAVSLQNSYYGKYIHGFFNSVFGKKDVKLPSDEGTEANVTPVFNDQGDMYYFTDFTSPKEDVDSMLGYSLTHARTGEITYYTGNLEESYMDSQGALQIIEKKFIEKKWKGQMPVLYNFYGEATWLTPVLDSNGFLQNYFLVSAANPEISVFASTPNDALKQYKLSLQQQGATVDYASDTEEKTVTAKVVRVYKERISEVTNIYLLLDNKQNFIVSSEVNPLAIYLQEDDVVTVTYLNTGEQFMPIKELRIQEIE